MGIESKELIAIPALGLSINNGNFDEVKDFIESIDYPVDNVIIMNSNNEDESSNNLRFKSKNPSPYVLNVEVINTKGNTWNHITEALPTKPYWVICDHRVLLKPGLLCKISELSKLTIPLDGDNAYHWDNFTSLDHFLKEPHKESDYFVITKNGVQNKIKAWADKFKSRVLVTGGAGFIGSNLIKSLLDKGYIVSSIDNYDSGSESNHVEGCTYYKGDIVTWMESNMEDFEICFHLAGLSRIQPSFSNPDETFRVNTIGTQKVLEFTKKNNVKLIYAGSSSRWHDPYQSPYATSKYLGEELCKMYRKTYDLHIEIARFYNVYGPGEIVDGDWAAVTGIWRRQVRDGEKITIVGDGNQRRDFTFVGDIVDGLIKILESGERHKDAWEFGTGMNYSINDVYEMFKRKFGVGKIHLPDQPGNYRETLRENDDSLDRLRWLPTDKLSNYIKNL